MTSTASRLATLDFVLDGLMRRYRERVPDVGAVEQCLIREGLIRASADIENDHIAFRTLGTHPLGIASLEKIFLHYGYLRRDAYDFPGKKLNAYWYAPPRPEYPRIFISELRVQDLSETSQRILRSYAGEVTSDPVDSLSLDDGAAVDDYLHRPLWRTPTWTDYQQLATESEYAAWVLYNRYYLNHFTVSVHHFPAGYRTIEQFNEFLEGHGFRLNDAGGKVKISEDGLLRQSSTVAAMVDAEFADGRGGWEVHPIAGSYVEFAERRVLPQFRDLPEDQVRREHRRDGFETANADRIFESTYAHQTRRDPLARTESPCPSLDERSD